MARKSGVTVSNEPARRDEALVARLQDGFLARADTDSRPGVDTIFGLDWRSLATFRVAVGLMTITDVVRRSLDFSAHYTDFGVVSAATATLQFRRSPIVSLYTLSDSSAWAVTLAVLTVLAAIAVVFGVFTRVAWIASWVLLLSLQHRNEWITNGGDVVFRLLYFWGAFLPVGARYSVDALFRKKDPSPPGERHLSMASVGLTLQIASLYFFAAVLKSGPDWHQDATAVFYALHLDKYATPIAVALRQFPELLKVGTTTVWYFEFFAPILLFSPFAPAVFRLALVLALMGMHLSFVACLRIGTFPWICIAGLSVLLPSLFWDLLAKPTRWHQWLDIATSRVRAAGTVVAESKAPALALELYARCSAALRRLSPLGHVAATGAVMLVILWNVGGIPGSGITLPKVPGQLSRLFGLDQHWDMFAPRPTRSDGWVVTPGYLVDGSPVDPWYLDEAPVSWAKQTLPAYNYTSERWIKFFEAMYERKSQKQIRSFAGYLCRRWDASFPPEKRLAKVEVYYMDDPTYPDGKRQAIPVLLGGFDCPVEFRDSE